MSREKLDAVLIDIVRSQDATYQGFGGYFKILDAVTRHKRNLDAAVKAAEQAAVPFGDPESFFKRQAN